jgi:hypothetical protein
MLKNLVFAIALVVMVLNIFVFDLGKSHYYFLNSAVISAFILFCYFWDSKNEEIAAVDKKILKIMMILTIVCLAAQGVITFLMSPIRMNDNLIAVFSGLNTIIFIFYIFKYEFKRMRG